MGGEAAEVASAFAFCSAGVASELIVVVFGVQLPWVEREGDVLVWGPPPPSLWTSAIPGYLAPGEAAPAECGRKEGNCKSRALCDCSILRRLLSFRRETLFQVDRCLELGKMLARASSMSSGSLLGCRRSAEPRTPTVGGCSPIFIRGKYSPPTTAGAPQICACWSSFGGWRGGGMWADGPLLGISTVSLPKFWPEESRSLLRSSAKHWISLPLSTWPATRKIPYGWTPSVIGGRRPPRAVPMRAMRAMSSGTCKRRANSTHLTGQVHRQQHCRPMAAGRDRAR